MQKLWALHVVVVLAGVGTLCWQATLSPNPKTSQPGLAVEPLFKGKSFSYWLDLLEKGDPLDVEEAITVLADIGPKATAALPALARALKDEFAPVRFKAAIAVWKIDRQGKEAAPVLAAVLKDVKSGSRLE